MVEHQEHLIQNINDTQCSSDYGAAGTAASYLSCYEKYSERAVITNSSKPTSHSLMMIT